MKEIQSFALDEQGVLIHAEDVDKKQNWKYFCPYCHKEMICRKGKIRTPHFAHKKEKCSYDQYLHSLAKRRICEWLNSAETVPIYIKQDSKCEDFEGCKFRRVCGGPPDICKETKEKKYDLKKWYHTCEEERDFITPNGRQYRADIFCHNSQNSNKPLIIEICVSHPIELEKRKSGIRIIEVKVKSENDIEKFINSPIKESDDVKFYGFKPIVKNHRPCM